MNNDLYFLPLLARAYKQPDRVAALRAALEEIRRLGQQDDYRRGHEQFRRFLLETYSKQVPSILIENEEGVLSEIPANNVGGEICVPGIRPGKYTVRLSTGRILWSGRLGREDVLWREAFPSRPLQLAADTDEAARLCTREVKLLDGEIVVRVCPGLDSGSMGIAVDRWKKT